MLHEFILSYCIFSTDKYVCVCVYSLFCFQETGSFDTISIILQWKVLLLSVALSVIVLCMIMFCWVKDNNKLTLQTSKLFVFLFHATAPLPLIQQVAVGDIVKVTNGQHLPADMIIISSRYPVWVWKYLMNWGAEDSKLCLYY